MFYMIRSKSLFFFQLNFAEGMRTFIIFELKTKQNRRKKNESQKNQKIKKSQKRKEKVK